MQQRRPPRKGALPFRMREEGLPKPKVPVNGTNEETLLDTGSVETFIRPSLVESAGLTSVPLEEGHYFVCADPQRSEKQGGRSQGSGDGKEGRTP